MRRGRPVTPGDLALSQWSDHPSRAVLAHGRRAARFRAPRRCGELRLKSQLGRGQDYRPGESRPSSSAADKVSSYRVSDRVPRSYPVGLRVRAGRSQRQKCRSSAWSGFGGRSATDSESAGSAPPRRTLDERERSGHARARQPGYEEACASAEAAPWWSTALEAVRTLSRGYVLWGGCRLSNAGKGVEGHAHATGGEMPPVAATTPAVRLRIGAGRRSTCAYACVRRCVVVRSRRTQRCR